MDKDIKVIDLFCGIGGLTYGLKKAGLNVILGIDIDNSCKYIYETNNNAPFMCKDIKTLDPNTLKSYFSKNDIKILVGCAPCQPFSSQTFKYNASKLHKDRDLLDYFLKIIKKIEPDIVSMENVPAITKQDVFYNFISYLKKKHYSVSYSFILAQNYGVPQNRRRLVLLASKYGTINILPETHNKSNYVKVKDIIKTLPPIKAGETYYIDPMHKAKNLEDINIKRIKQSKPKGSWKDWDESLLPNCYKKPSGSSYTSVYGRMSFDDISPTITTQFYNYGSGRFGHPEQDRAISLREGALLQTFPIEYDFGNDINFTKTGRHIGNAVPPKLAEIIGKSILEHIRKYV